MKKIPKINKPISLTSKNIARIYTDLVRRNANIIRSQNRMSGGLNNDQIKEFQGFLTEYAETVGKLKYILLDKLCDHTIDMITAKNTIKYNDDRYILEKIYKSFTDNPELYKYNIPAIEHTDPDINFLINALKLVSSFDSSVSKLKTPGLEEVNSTYTFDTRYIPTELLQKDNKEDFEKEYREIQKKRGIIPELLQSPRQRPLPSPLPAKETPEEARKRLLRDSLILSRKIVVSQEADTKPELITDIQLKKEKTHILWVKLRTYIKKKQYKTNNLQDRINKYNRINKALRNMKIKYDTCLIKKTSNGIDGYTMGELALSKNIGSDSAVGKIFLTSVINEEIVSKVMEANTQNKNETKINEWITNNLILKNWSKHFALTYKTTECITNNTNLKNNEKLVNYIELCDGDLDFLMKDTSVINNLELMKNIAFQVLIAIATYQNNVGFCHLDTHGGNFLFQKNEKIDNNGYYHYIYNNNSFYIKSCEYNIIIFDFGLSAPINIVNDYVLIEDYMRIIKIIISVIKPDKGIINNPINDAMNLIISELNNIKVSFESTKCDIFQAIINKIISVGGDDQTIYKNIKPTTVLNNIPFKINNVEIEYLKLNIDNSLGERLERFRLLYLSNIHVKNIKDQKFVNNINGIDIYEILLNYKPEIIEKGYKHGYIIKYIPPYSYPIVKKVMDVNTINIKNIMINFAIRNILILNESSKHFLLELGGPNNKNYDYYLNYNYNLNYSLDNNDLEIYDNKKIVCYTELWDSYLSKLLLDLNVINNTDLMINMLFQAFICIATYHNILGLVYPANIIKADNFLVQTNDYKGYYCYKYDEEKLYLKDCEYNIIINDFGSSIIIKNDDESKQLIHQNYMDILNIFKVSVNDQQSDIYIKLANIETTLTKMTHSLNIFQDIIDKIFKMDINKTYSNSGEGTNIINFIFPYKIKNTNSLTYESNSKIFINKLKINLQEDLEIIVKTYNLISQIIKILLEIEAGLLDIEKNIINREEDKLKNTEQIKQMEQMEQMEQKFIHNNEFSYHIIQTKNFVINKYLILSSTLNIEDAKNIMEEICNNLKKLNKYIITKKSIIDKGKTTITIQDELEDINNKLLSLISLIETHAKLLVSNPEEEDDLSGGRKPTKYKSTGNAVFIMYKKKKYKRTIYVKDRRKTKYCKINNEYILLSKLKIIE